MTSAPSQHLRSFLSDDRAATAVEYALLAALIAGVCALAVSAIGVSVNDWFTDAQTGW